MLAILSSAKTLDYESPLPSFVKPTKPLFVKQAHDLVKSLKSLSEKDLGKIMSISPKLAKQNYERYQEFASAPERPAIYSYQGDAFKSLQLSEYGKTELSYAQKSVLFVSGLYGLLRPLDAMKPYRLEMLTQNISIKQKSLYSFWKDRLSEYVDSVEKGRGACLINLASKEYSKAVCTSALRTPVINIDFKESKNGKLSVVALFAKQARGAMIDFMILEKIKKPEQLKEFDWKGYCFEPKLSNDGCYTFVRG
jgi:cytoplasmic iron level regulating protein YaaA (DUF328/UPF0246 family)